LIPGGTISTGVNAQDGGRIAEDLMASGLLYTGIEGREENRGE
jgi:hypothetical protein